MHINLVVKMSHEKRCLRWADHRQSMSSTSSRRHSPSSMTMQTASYLRQMTSIHMEIVVEMSLKNRCVRWADHRRSMSSTSSRRHSPSSMTMRAASRGSSSSALCGAASAPSCCRGTGLNASMQG